MARSARSQATPDKTNRRIYCIVHRVRGQLKGLGILAIWKDQGQQAKGIEQPAPAGATENQDAGYRRLGFACISAFAIKIL